MEPQNDQLMPLRDPYVAQQEDAFKQPLNFFAELRKSVLEQERLRDEAERLHKMVEALAAEAVAERKQQELVSDGKTWKGLDLYA
ncbi:hypothetical protein DL768_001571 [Monosporascus sp. mg162]|nr:hypothetical protein DL768_001571 [Monosporascus sp. mg162]